MNQEVIKVDRPSHLAVFDLCNTLYFSNTTFDFIEYALRKNHSRFRLGFFHLISKRFSPIGILLLCIEKFCYKDLIKVLAVRQLRGLSRNELNDHAERFVSEYLRQRKIHEIHQMLQRVKKSDAMIYLMSESLEPIVRAVSNELEVGYFGVKLRFCDGYSTGHLEGGGQKLDWVSGIDHDILTAVSDNKTDCLLLEKADHGYAVIQYARYSRFWRTFPSIKHIKV